MTSFRVFASDAERAGANGGVQRQTILTVTVLLLCVLELARKETTAAGF